MRADGFSSRKFSKARDIMFSCHPRKSRFVRRSNSPLKKKQKNKQKAKLIEGLPCAAYGAMKDGESVCEAKALTDENGSVRFENISGYCIHLETQQRITRLSY